MEWRYKTIKIIVIYVVSGLGGNIFSSLITDYPSVGASTAIFGLLGALIGYMLFNWNALG